MEKIDSYMINAVYGESGNPYALKFMKYQIAILGTPHLVEGSTLDELVERFIEVHKGAEMQIDFSAEFSSFEKTCASLTAREEISAPVRVEDIIQFRVKLWKTIGEDYRTPMSPYKKN